MVSPVGDLLHNGVLVVPQLLLLVSANDDVSIFFGTYLQT